MESKEIFLSVILTLNTNDDVARGDGVASDAVAGRLDEQ